MVVPVQIPTMVDVDKAMAEVANYIVGPEEAENMLKKMKSSVGYMDDIQDGDIEVLVGALDFLRFQPNDPLISKGEEASWAGFIMEGSVGVMVGEKQVATMEAGKLLGGMAYFFGATRTADCAGGEHGGVIAAIEFAELKRLEKEQPEVAMRLCNVLATGELENLLARIERMENPNAKPEQKKTKKTKPGANQRHKAEVLYRSKAAAAAKEAKRIKAMMDRQAAEVAKMKASKKNEKHVLNKLNKQLKEKDDMIAKLEATIKSGGGGGDEKKAATSKADAQRMKKMADKIKALEEELGKAQALAEDNKGADPAELEDAKRKAARAEASNQSLLAQLAEAKSRAESVTKERDELLVIVSDNSVDPEEAARVQAMLAEGEAKRKTLETRLRFAAIYKDEVDVKLKEALQNLKDMEEAMSLIRAERNALKRGESAEITDLREKISTMEAELEHLRKSVKSEHSDLLAYKMLVKMLHDSNAKKILQAQTLKSKVEFLTREYMAMELAAKTTNQSYSVFAAALTALAHEEVKSQCVIEETVVQAEADRKAQASAHLQQLDAERKLHLSEKLEAETRFATELGKVHHDMETVKEQCAIAMETCMKDAEKIKRDMALRMKARMDEYGEEKRKCDQKLVVTEVRLKEATQKLEKSEEELQQSRMLCANMTAALKSLDWVAMRQSHQNQLLLFCLVDIASSFFLSAKRRVELERSFGGLAHGDALSMDTLNVDFTATCKPSQSLQNEGALPQSIGGRLGLSPRGELPPYLSLSHLHSGGNDARRGHQLQQKKRQLEGEMRRQPERPSRNASHRKLPVKSPRRMPSNGDVSPNRQQRLYMSGNGASPTSQVAFTKSVRSSDGIVMTNASSVTKLAQQKELHGFHAIRNNTRATDILGFLGAPTVSFSSKYNPTRKGGYRGCLPLINFKAYTAIVIDHNEELMKSTVAVLKSVGIGAVHTARTIEVARSIFDTTLIDLVLVRYWMPEGVVTETLSQLLGTQVTQSRMQRNETDFRRASTLAFWHKSTGQVSVLTTYDPACRAEQDSIFSADKSGRRLSDAWNKSGSKRSVAAPLRPPGTDGKPLSLPIDRQNDMPTRLHKLFLRQLCATSDRGVDGERVTALPDEERRES